MKQIDIRYAFSIPGFRILASAAGIEHLPCFSTSLEQEDISTERYQTELFGLVKRGLIEIQEEQYLLSKPCSDIVRTIRDRKKTYLVQGRDIELIYYIADGNAVEATPGRKQDEYICLEYLEKEDLIDHIRCILPDNLFPEEVLLEKAESEDNPDSGEDVLNIEIFGTADEKESVYRIFTNEDYLYYVKDDVVKIYQKEEFIDVLTEVYRGKK